MSTPTISELSEYALAIQNSLSRLRNSDPVIDSIIIDDLKGPLANFYNCLVNYEELKKKQDEEYDEKYNKMLEEMDKRRHQ